MSDTSLRARGPSEIVDAAFALYRRHAKPYLMVTAIAMTPALILNLIFVSGQSQPNPEAPFQDLWRIFPGMLAGLISYTLVGAFVSQMGSDVYLGREPDVGATLRSVIPMLPRLIGYLIVSSLLFGASFLLLIIPAIFVFIKTVVANNALVIERKGVFSSISRSWGLTKKRKGHVFGTLALLFGIYFIIGIGFFVAGAASGNETVQQILNSVVGILAAPLLQLGIMVLYYDLRIRSEGFDLEHMAQSIAPSQTSPFVGTPAS